MHDDSKFKHDLNAEVSLSSKCRFHNGQIFYRRSGDGIELSS